MITKLAKVFGKCFSNNEELIRINILMMAMNANKELIVTEVILIFKNIIFHSLIFLLISEMQLIKSNLNL
jgi:hypothetical protein